jgi:hypothetical protein
MRGVISSAALFLSRSGEIHFDDTFLSPRIVREALAKKFRVITIEETGNHLRLRIIRYLRIYGGPMIWPQASVDISIQKLGGRFSLHWYFVWPEYYVLLFGLPILFALGCVNSGYKGIAFPTLVIFFLFAFVVFGALIFLDTLWVSKRVRETFAKL